MAAACAGTACGVARGTTVDLHDVIPMFVCSADSVDGVRAER